MIHLSLFIDIDYIYREIEQLRPFEDVSIGETLGSINKRTSSLKWTHKYFTTIISLHTCTQVL
jgi:hypothetical protein